jgi:tetratricopeptide (TPR) repeat protein
MRRDEEDRRERFEAGMTALYTQARDIALAAYDGEAASDAIVELARTIHGANAAGVSKFLSSEAQALHEIGDRGGSNVHLVAEIALRREQLMLAASADEQGVALGNLGHALATLGERESETEKLEQAVVAYHAALEKRTRDRVPLDWAMTQNNLGAALMRLGERESETEKLDQAVQAYRAALEERTRERVPLQ